MFAIFSALLVSCLTARQGEDSASFIDLGGGDDSAAQDTAADDTAADDTGSDDTAADDTGGDDTAIDDTGVSDVDGDGWSVVDGDCDDGDPDVNPGVSADDCDDVDSDCDGVVDEDFDGDSYEPNDEDGADLGDLGDEGEALVYGYLFDEDDEDRFRFHVDDPSLGWFSVEIWLYNVPDDADYALELIWVEDADGDWRGSVGTADDDTDGGDEVIDWGGETGWDDSGWYEVVVSSVDGASCHSPYTLQVLVGGW